MRFQIYKSGNQYRWRLLAANNKIIADSGEAYHNKQDCIAGINLVKGTGLSTPVDDLA